VELKNLDDRLRSDLRFLDLERLRETEIIKGKILRLRSELAISEDLFNDFASLNSTSGRSTADSLAIIDLELLDQSLKGVEEYHRAEKQRLLNVHKENKRALRERIVLQEKEINLLRSEETELMQLAPFDGTIGNVYVEQDEVIDAFVNILSVYEENPSIIKAFMEERQSYEVRLGQNVVVESANREYSEVGEVIEIGSRIVEYPSRLSGLKPMYGQEIFVQIPQDNRFLNGERVRVLID
jgi:multidrug resistance efflux pump